MDIHTASETISAAAPVSAPALHAHLTPLPNEDWALWKWVGIRGAGFPAALVDGLAAPASAAAADELLRCEHEWRATRDRQDETTGRRAAIVETARARYLQAFAEETAAVSARLGDIASQNQFREAVLWQNRRAVHTGLDPLARACREGRPRRSQQRQHEELVARYLQRYCLKNETIGFFGPVGWATFRPDGPACTVRPGARLLAVRHLYFEVWAVDALAAALGADERLDRWLTPRRSFRVHLEGGMLFTSDGAPRAVDAVDAALLTACNGERTVVEIASRLVRDSSTGLRSEEDVLARYRALRAEGLVTLALGVPMELHAERSLASALGRSGDPALRASMLGALEEMEQARAEVARAAGDAEALDRALGDLERRFTRLTGRGSTRTDRDSLARALVYEDCRRDLDADFGPELVQALSAPLALLLTSARWLTYDTARRYLALLSEIHDDLAQAAGGGPVPLGSFFDRAFPVLFGPGATCGLDSLAAFQQAWEAILDLPPDAPRVQHASAQLRPAVLRAFEAPAPGWPFACYHSPDLMIAARSVENIRRGDYQLVLGELHLGANTLGWPTFLAQHPAEQELRHAAALDIPHRRLEPIVPRYVWPGLAARLLPTLISPWDLRLELSTDPTGVPDACVLPMASLVLERDGTRVVVRTRDRRVEFDLIDVVAQALTWQVMGRFKMVGRRPHVPRVTIDRVVVCRESWSCPPAACTFAQEIDEAGRFLGARRWARDRGLPRYVFVKTPIEKKPFYIDFASPVYVNLLSKSLRRSLAASPEMPVTFTEMLPCADETWLPDAHGTRYSCELRIAAVDLRGSPHRPA